MRFPLVPKSVTLNAIMAVILQYLIEIGTFRANYDIVVEARPTLSVIDKDVAQRI